MDQRINWKFNTSVFSAASADRKRKSVASADHSQGLSSGGLFKRVQVLKFNFCFRSNFFKHTHRISHAQWPKNKQVLKDVPHVLVDQTKKKHAWVPGRVCGYRLRLQSPPGGGKDGRHNVLSVEIPGWSLKQTNLKNTIHSTYIHHLAYL